MTRMHLTDLLAASRRTAFAGLAKNTGKTTALVSALTGLSEGRRFVGITSLGRDGEEWDVLDRDVGKPRIWLPLASVVATTDVLWQRSGLRYETLHVTDYRTPLGRVVIGRVLTPGHVEVAGPSTAAQLRTVIDAITGVGIDHLLLDGSINRRIGCSPALVDGVVLATGAVVDQNPAGVARHTRRAADLLRLPPVTDTRVRAAAAGRATPALLPDDGEPIPLPARLPLAADAGDLGEVFRPHPGHCRLLLPGALCESFLRRVADSRRGRPITFVVVDSTKVLLP
ncbi:hypothetical protein, partial [Micromonospora sp. NPDC051296]|uniref:hypothetical protein n=1 Tax=Micromonospora sp. NPDC051296 TaxID=3155046 RepID=UPI00343C31D2